HPAARRCRRPGRARAATRPRPAPARRPGERPRRSQAAGRRSPVSAVELPRLLRSGATLEEHLEAHGPLPAEPDLIDACARAGLRGRGGALFPAAVKLQAVASGRGARTVVVNAAEGEPMSAKDRVLLERA